MALNIDSNLAKQITGVMVIPENLSFSQIVDTIILYSKIAEEEKKPEEEEEEEDEEEEEEEEDEETSPRVVKPQKEYVAKREGLTTLETWFLTAMEEEFQHHEKDEWDDYLFHLPESVKELGEEFLGFYLKDEANPKSKYDLIMRRAVLDSVDWDKITKECVKYIKSVVEKDPEYSHLCVRLEKYI